MHPYNNKSTRQVLPSGDRGLFISFQQYIIQQKLFPTKARLLLAVSGGVDSVVLCELCKQAGYDFAIAHCNFQLRKEESGEDENFVKQLAGKYGVDFFVKKFETENFAREKKYSIQEAARILRYEWFRLLIDQSNDKPLNCVLTAHHANDNLETLLMNFFKGTGIAGLQGIPAKSELVNDLIRPLLFAKKETILQFAKENKLAFREDSSNSSNKYTRNYFRNELIPALEKVYPQVQENLLDNIERFKDIHILYRQSVSAIKKKLLVEQEHEIHIPVLKLLKTEALPAVVFEIIREYGFGNNQVHDVIKLLNSESGKYIESGSHRILKNRKWLIISTLNARDISHYLVRENDSQIIFAGGRITIEKTGQVIIPAGNDIAMLDAAYIKFPLLLRKWKQGDYFYPLGMKHKKKLSRFFIDKKLSLNEKEDTWVIETNKKIAWVIGHRIDERFRVTDHTKQVLKITVHKA